MKVSDLDLDSQSINFLHSEGFTELYEPQEYSVDAGILNDLVISKRQGESYDITQYKNKKFKIEGKEYNIELSRLIKVFNNNIWQHKKSIK